MANRSITNMRVLGMRVLSVALVMALSARANDHAPAKDEHGKAAPAKPAEHAKPDEHGKPAPRAKAAEHGKPEAKKAEDTKTEHKQAEPKNDVSKKESHAEPVKTSPLPEKEATHPAPPKKPAKRPAVARAKPRQRERIVLNWDRTATVKWEPRPDDRPVRIEWQTAQR